MAVFAAIIVFVAGPGCANIVPPSGGPRDTLPPRIAQVDPPAETLHFNSKKIVFTFNEYVELDDVQKNLVITPLPKIMPDVSRKLKTATVKFRDSLEPNTTYVLNFKNVIKDLNEGNKAKDMVYVVSTGNYFDSMQLSGRVKIANTNKPDSTLTIMLHDDLNDSAVVKKRPRYIAKLDTTGYFLFNYLKPGKYRLYAIKDESGAYMYTSKQQLFAFADSPVVIAPEPPTPILLLAYASEDEKKAEGDDKAANKNDKEKRLKFATNLQGKQQDLLEPLIFTFEKTLKDFDTTKMAFTADSTFTTATGNTYTMDSTRKIVTMNMRWEEGKRYNLILQKDFASDSLNRQLLKPDTLIFTTKTRKDYGQAKITFKNLDISKKPVLLVVQNGKVKNAFPLQGNILDIQLYQPGEYEMQLLYDANENNKWDPGEFFKEHRQPERIFPIERKLIIKADIMAEFELLL